MFTLMEGELVVKHWPMDLPVAMFFMGMSASRLINGQVSNGALSVVLHLFFAVSIILLVCMFVNNKVVFDEGEICITYGFFRFRVAADDIIRVKIKQERNFILIRKKPMFFVKIWSGKVFSNTIRIMDRDGFVDGLCYMRPDLREIIEEQHEG